MQEHLAVGTLNLELPCIPVPFPSLKTLDFEDAVERGEALEKFAENIYAPAVHTLKTGLGQSLRMKDYVSLVKATPNVRQLVFGASLDVERLEKKQSICHRHLRSLVYMTFSDRGVSNNSRLLHLLTHDAPGLTRVKLDVQLALIGKDFFKFTPLRSVTDLELEVGSRSLKASKKELEHISLLFSQFPEIRSLELKLRSPNNKNPSKSSTDLVNTISTLVLGAIENNFGSLVKLRLINWPVNTKGLLKLVRRLCGQAASRQFPGTVSIYAAGCLVQEGPCIRRWDYHDDVQLALLDSVPLYGERAPLHVTSSVLGYDRLVFKSQGLHSVLHTLNNTYS